MVYGPCPLFPFGSDATPKIKLKRDPLGARSNGCFRPEPVVSYRSGADRQTLIRGHRAVHPSVARIRVMASASMDLVDRRVPCVQAAAERRSGLPAAVLDVGRHFVRRVTLALLREPLEPLGVGRIVCLLANRLDPGAQAPPANDHDPANHIRDQR
jgi:hypothetical protein